MLDVLQTWVDASYTTHHNMRGDTGGLMFLGHGVIHDTCSKKKLNTKSSTSEVARENVDVIH